MSAGRKANPALDALRRNVTGAIERGEAEAIVEKRATLFDAERAKGALAYHKKWEYHDNGHVAEFLESAISEIDRLKSAAVVTWELLVMAGKKIDASAAQNAALLAALEAFTEQYQKLTGFPNIIGPFVGPYVAAKSAVEKARG